jgi:hypothetical protein
MSVQVSLCMRRFWPETLRLQEGDTDKEPLTGLRPVEVNVLLFLKVQLTAHINEGD